MLILFSLGADLLLLSHIERRRSISSSPATSPVFCYLLCMRAIPHLWQLLYIYFSSFLEFKRTSFVSQGALSLVLCPTTFFTSLVVISLSTNNMPGDRVRAVPIIDYRAGKRLGDYSNSQFRDPVSVVSAFDKDTKIPNVTISPCAVAFMN